MIGYQDGAWLEATSLSVSIDDPGLLVGDGVFESVRLHDRRYYALDAHLERLAGSAQILRIELPSPERLREVLLELVRRNTITEASARLLVTRGAPGRGPVVTATLRAVSDDWRARAAVGWNIVTAHTRHPDPATLPARLKSVGRVHSVLARFEAVDAGADDALLLAHDGAVAEGSTWNFFFGASDALRTAAIEVGVLPGVTRSTVLELARNAGIDVLEGRFARAELDRADAAFATMSSLGVVPVTRLDGRVLPRSVDIAAELQTLYWDHVRTHAEAVDG